MSRAKANKTEHFSSQAAPQSDASAGSTWDHPPSAKSKTPRPHTRWRIAGIIFLVIVALGVGSRLMLPWALRSYVNRVLDRNLLYKGRIGDITVNLWRGAYAIDNIRLNKTTGDVPTPFIQIKRLELAVQWHALLHGKVVGKVAMDLPQLNFVASSEDSDAQTGAGTPWLETLRSLFPLQLNSVKVHDGSIHFRSYKNAKPVDVYLSQLEASVDDLTNIMGSTAPLVTTVNATGQAMRQAPFEFHMKLDPFSYRPSFEMACRLIDLDVTKLNDLTRTYGQFDFKRGWFDLVVQVTASEGQMHGYVKPLFRNLKVFDLIDDLKQDQDPLQYFWQALLGITTELLKNQSRDQFGTYIPFTGDLDQPNPDILATIGNVLRNAFIRAYLPKLQNGSDTFDGMVFLRASILDPSSVGD